MDKQKRKKIASIMTERRDTMIPAFLGDLVNQVVEVEGEPSYVYATIAFTGQVIKVKNSRVPLRLRLPVIVGYPRGSHLLQVISIWDVYPNLDIPEVPHHDHTWGTSDNPAWILKKQILDLLPSAAGGMTIRVGGGDYAIDNVVNTLPTTDFDMTSYIPASGAKWVAVSVDIDGVATYTEGDVVGNRFLLSVQNLPAVSESMLFLFACKVYVGQTAIIDSTTTTDIYDPRFIRSTGSMYWDDIVGKPTEITEDLSSQIDGVTNHFILSHTAIEKIKVYCNILQPITSYAMDDDYNGFTLSFVPTAYDSLLVRYEY